MFDGVHLGHQKILALLNDEAKKNEGESLLLTFNPHPRFVFDTNADLKILTTQEEKIEKLRAAINLREFMFTCLVCCKVAALIVEIAVLKQLICPEKYFLDVFNLL